MGREQRSAAKMETRSAQVPLIATDVGRSAPDGEISKVTLRSLQEFDQRAHREGPDRHEVEREKSEADGFGVEVTADGWDLPARTMNKPNYGIDAPEVVRRFFVFGVIG